MLERPLIAIVIDKRLFCSSLQMVSAYSCCFHVFRSTLAFITVLSFLLGALCSGIAGYIGMWVSVRANVRVSSAARRSAREALLVCVPYSTVLE